MEDAMFEFEDLAARLHRGARLLGLIVKMPAPATVEIAGLAGFDLVVIDTEHGLADGTELQHHLRAADSVGVPALVRVSGWIGGDILRVLDAGAAGVIVPHVRSSDDVARAVDAARYPPQGQRSLALSTRSGRYGQRSIPEHVASAGGTLVIAQIEDSVALERADEIAAAPGLDSVFIGPTDLSASLGRPGEFDHPAVVDAIDRIAAGVLAADGTALCVIADDEQDGAAWFDRGAGIVLFEATMLISRGLCRVRELSRVSAGEPRRPVG